VQIEAVQYAMCNVQGHGLSDACDLGTGLTERILLDGLVEDISKLSQNAR